MSKSQELLNSFGSEANVVKVVAVYLGADIRENSENQFSHQLSLLPSNRDPRGGVVSLKNKEKIGFQTNGVYYIEAEAGSPRPDNHFGVSIYWLRNPRKINLISKFNEVEKKDG